MDRLDDWEQRAVRWFDDRRNMPHIWGNNDCAIFCADFVREITGIDLAEGVRGRYGDEDAALRTMSEFGATDLRELVSAHLPEIPPNEAHRGDVMLLRGPQEPFLGVLWGAEVLAPGENVLERVSPALALAAWRVG